MAIILNCSALIPLSSGLLRWRRLQWKGNSRRIFLTKEENFGMFFLGEKASLVAQLVTNLPAMQKTWVQSLGWEDPLEKGKATHSSILAWRIPSTVQSMGLQRVRRD